MLIAFTSRCLLEGNKKDSVVFVIILLFVVVIIDVDLSENKRNNVTCFSPFGVINMS